ncbi:iron-containing alcohol dehydrogenase family protein [Alkalicoccus chagannorensis]|uniref:iron-containing alcohol dehydrogenase family protein n=1 Tax=Alkalicoccus chagannorensis TaxID=427072 RepID=UPI00042836EA|nr:iron-containing alcohol dehydrogenase [Alkalicoccus chagannorensis]
MRTSWSVNSTEEIRFGAGAVQELPDLCRKFDAENIVIVTDQGIVNAGILEKVEAVMAEFKVFVYDKALPEPPVESAVECLEAAKSEMHPDLIIGLGGGSSIDLAKVVALLLEHGGAPEDYYGEHQVPGPVAPLIAIPTTAGTGSEVTSVTVLTDKKKQIKTGISANELRPKAALLDPELTLKLPAYVTACSGIDALSHAVEALTAKESSYIEAEGKLLFQGANPISDALALQAIKHIVPNLALAVHQGSNLEARKEMMLGSLLAGQAFSNAGTAAAHALAYPIGGRTSSPHGELTGLLLPYVVDFNRPAAKGKIAEAERAVNPQSALIDDDEAALLFVERLFELLEDIGLPVTLEEIGLDEAALPDVAEQALNVARLVRNNPRKPDVKSFTALLERAYRGREYA